MTYRSRKALCSAVILAAGMAPVALGATDSVVVDNLDAGCSLTGEWNESVRDTPFKGANYVWAANTARATATCSAGLAAAGKYSVHVWFCSSMDSDRAGNATYSAGHGGAVDTIVVSQKPSAGFNNKWHLLGAWQFAAGEEASVTLDNAGANHSVSADAVMWVLDELAATKAREVRRRRTDGTNCEYVMAVEHGATIRIGPDVRSGPNRTVRVVNLTGRRANGRGARAAGVVILSR